MDKSSSHVVTYPKTVNHIAVSVTDLDKAVKWYKEVFGFTVINGPVEFEADNSSLGMAAKDIHGPNFKKIVCYRQHTVSYQWKMLLNFFRTENKIGLL